MGIQTEYNPDLALRDITHYMEGNRKKEECIPDNLEEGGEYEFLKEGQRNYFLMGECPLLKTEGDGKLSKPLASIQILKATHFVLDGEIYTKGTYRVINLIDSGQIYFNGFNKV